MVGKAKAKEIPQIKPVSILDPTDDTAKKSRFRIDRKLAIKLAAVFAVVFAVTTVFVVMPIVSVIVDGRALASSARSVRESLQSQDIVVVKASMNELRGDFERFDKSYSRLRPVAYLPLVGAYYRDGEAALAAGVHALDASDILIEVMEPYVDIIGFGGVEVAPGEDTANDRIEFLIHTIDDIIPHADEISEKARLVQAELAKIDTSRYPEHFRGRPVRAQLSEGLALAEEATTFLANSKPLLTAAPYLLGLDETRTYLLLFQNDKELRATGGFLTAYSIIEVTNGKILPVSSNDIYNLDGRYTPSVPAAEPIIEYIKGPYLISKNYRLRDMNWSPDFRESMEFFLAEAQSAGIADIDGVIAVDTHVVVNILNAIGAVDVPGFGLYSSENDPRCDCPQVVYELESYADVEGPIVWSENEPGVIVFAPANYLNRKDIVGPLMNTVLANSLGQPKEKLPDLFQAGWKSLTEKNVLLYMFDEEAQSAVEAFGIAGRILPYEGDYLHINDSNLGGRKSNMYVTQEVVQEIEIENDGSIVKTVNITYQNPQDHDGWLNSVLPNWTRIYIPQGSEVVDTTGFEDDGGIYEELGKTVVAGGFELRPKGVKRLSIKYRLPFKLEGGQYSLFIQKQPGTAGFLHTVNAGRSTEEFYLRTDREFKFRI